MDIGKAFTFMFEDEQWVSKLLVASVLALFGFFLLIPLLPLIGYMVEVQQNVARGEARPLPDWNNIGVKTLKGLNVVVILFIYSLPVIVLTCCLLLLVAVTPSSKDANPIGLLLGLYTLCYICVVSLYSFALAVFTPAAVTLYAATDRVSDAFRVMQVMGFIRRNAGNYAAAVIFGLVASFIAQFGILICGVGLAATYAWWLLVHGYLFGQVYRAAQAPPPAPPMPAAPAM
ncbi:MAG: DUF4013 domain-containing protein [Chloroflexi bacterium]|nr:DUF4013 domain-containing protein [Chloroflexota bacterium]